MPPRRQTPKLNAGVIKQEKVMLRSTSKQWHTVSLRCAMPIAGRFDYVEDQPQSENPTGAGG